MLRCFAAGLIFLTGIACAQTFPAKPISLVVPFTTGAANDTLARTLGAEMRDSLGAVMVENKPGANGAIAAEYVKRSAPDGHTLLVVNDSYLILSAMNNTLPYDMLRDFDSVVHASGLPFFLVINQEAIPVKTVREFVEYVRARPGKLSYATPGNGTPHHLSTELLRQAAGLEVTHIPYKGMAVALPDLIAGRVQFTITGLPAVASQLKSGKLRVLATVGRTRSAVLPDVPTFAEAGVPGVEMNFWMGVVAPAGTPKPVVARLNAEFNRVLQLPAVREKLAAQGIDAAGGTPEDFAARMRADRAIYSQVIKTTGIRED